MELWKTLTVTGVGFVLTGIVGTWISYFWQTRNWRHQQEYIRSKELISKQIEIVEQLSNLVGRRKFRMFRAAAALRSTNPDRIAESWKNYDESVVEWNDNVNGYITKLRQFFKRDLQYSLDREITPEFQLIGSMLEKAKRRYELKKTDSQYFGLLREISDRLENLNGFSNDFIGSLWQHIDGLKERIDGRPTISHEAIHELSIYYLLKQIFVLRKQT